MAVYLGNNKLTFDGISEIYVGSNKVYSSAIDYSTEYFFVENLTNNANTLSIKKNNASAPTINVYRSIDKTNWTSIGSTSTTAITYSIPANSKVYLRATTNSWSTSGYYNSITCSGNFAVGGNIMSLLYGSSFIGKTVFPTSSTYNFSRLFQNSTNLKNIVNLVLPATTLTQGCYQFMFSGCTGLTSIPRLPATTLANNCYNSMFSGCTGITSIPLLPATTLTNYCYNSMFSGCTGLTSIPSNLLPATTLSDSCYQGMFSGCTGLTSIPSNLLPATTLSDSFCYGFMFQDCTGITSIPSDLLPATTLAKYCYFFMFMNCTGLTKAPELPATTLANGCYGNMFYGCSSLNEITCYANDISATGCTSSWVYGVAASGTFHKKGSANWTTGIDGIPTGWTVIDDSPYNPINDYFWIENRKSSSDTIQFTIITNLTNSKFHPTIAGDVEDFFYYSTDKSTWTSHTGTNLTIPANTRYYFYSNRSEGYNQQNGYVSSGIAFAYFKSFSGLMAAAKINGSFQPTLYANLGFGGNASSNFAIGGNIRTLLGKGTGGVGDTSLIERGRKQSLAVQSSNECKYVGYTALGTSSTSFSNYSNDIGLFFTGITDAGNLYIGNSDHEAEFSLITPTTLPIYT